MSRRSPEQVDAEHAWHAGSGPHDGPRCDCHHDGTRWLKLCAAAQAECDALHAQAMADYVANRPREIPQT